MDTSIRAGRFIALAIAAAALLFSGCSSVPVVSSHKIDVGATRFPPTSANKVEILRSKPERAHVQLGTVQAEPANEDVDVALIENALRDEAAKLGADAVIVTSDRTEVSGAYATGGPRSRSIQIDKTRVIDAIAIKYQ